MVISQLVAQLLRIQQDDGDLEVRFASDIPPSDENEFGDSVEIEGVATVIDEGDQGVYVVICDTDTLDAIS